MHGATLASVDIMLGTASLFPLSQVGKCKWSSHLSTFPLCEQVPCEVWDWHDELVEDEPEPRWIFGVLAA